MKSSDEAIQHVFPIFKPEDATGDRPAIQGSATWVTVGPHQFAVTANHVLDQTDGSTLYLSDGAELLIAKENLARTSEAPYADYNRDPADIAVFRLTPDQCERLATVRKSPVPITEWASEATHLDGRPYTFIGYPASRLKVNFGRKSMKPGPYTFTCGSVTQPEMLAYGWSPALHLVARFNREEMHTGDRVQKTAPEPYGMSGGPVLAKDAGSGLIHMVGVGIFFSPEKHYLVGTRITAVLSGMRQAFYETREFLS
jgi:hypothetical protein